MIGYDPLAYFVFLGAAFTVFVFATILTGRAFVSRQHTVARVRQIVGAGLSWALCGSLLFAPYFGAADWLASML